MVRRLVAAGLVGQARYSGISLIPADRAAAAAVVRRHRLVETFMATKPGLGWHEVHAEAEVLEHTASDPPLDRMTIVSGARRSTRTENPIRVRTGA